MPFLSILSSPHHSRLQVRAQFAQPVRLILCLGYAKIYGHLGYSEPWLWAIGLQSCGKDWMTGAFCVLLAYIQD